jgi:molybdenum cofactor biosynthesis enzyme MoaA
MRHSKYWDDFERRIQEVSKALKEGTKPPIRRVSCFITNKCNFRCQYCNCVFGSKELSNERFDQIVQTYPRSIIHITGGEPSTIPWLYPYIEKTKATFHLNTNAYIPPPKNIKRLKVSLDSCDPDVFNNLVQVDAFSRVVKNIQKASTETVVSVTCLLNQETYKDTPKFMKWCRKNLPHIYAVFFSVYKGDNPRFKFTNKSVEDFFQNIKPQLEAEMDQESYDLLNETLDEKLRIMQGIRFPENNCGKCYLSMSEKVFDCFGGEFNCSHLFRDGVKHTTNNKHPKCLYGCNRRLVAFNQEVERLVN